MAIAMPYKYIKTHSCVSTVTRHMAWCVIYRKQKVADFNLLYLYNYLPIFTKFPLFYALHIATQPYISNLKEIGLVVCEILYALP